MLILVTGGKGLVGSAINKRYKLNSHSYSNIEWVFLSSKDCDLTKIDQVDHLFNSFKPDVIIHLAAKVAGLYGNMANNYSMLSDNLKINGNILDACKKYKVKRLINILSTCIFPDQNIVYPLTSDQILKGPPHFSNEGYAYSKRLLYVGSKILSQETNTEVVNLTPTNLYGENDNYNLLNSHVIPGLIHKCYIANKQHNNLFVKGSGKAKRQFLYANDFADIILEFVTLPLSNKFNTLIVSPPSYNEMSISELVNHITNELDFKKLVVYNSDPDGQINKTCDDSELYQFLPDFEFTPFNKGLEETITYFKKHYKSIRK